MKVSAGEHKMANELEVKIGDYQTHFGNMQEHTSLFKEFWRAFRKNRLAVFSGIILLLIIVTAVCAPLLVTHDPYRINLARELQKLPPSATHLLGTRCLEQDVIRVQHLTAGQFYDDDYFGNSGLCLWSGLRLLWWPSRFNHDEAG